MFVSRTYTGPDTKQNEMRPTVFKSLPSIQSFIKTVPEMPGD